MRLFSSYIFSSDKKSLIPTLAIARQIQIKKVRPIMKKDINNFTLLSLTQAAKMLKIGRDTLYYLIQQGKIKVIKIKHQLKIPYNELERFINENMVVYSDDTVLNQIEYISNQTIKPTYNSVELFKQLRGDV